MILKLISSQPNIDIANYSFALNFSNMLVLIPFTIVQVDIEKIKYLANAKPIAYKILKLVLLFSILVFGVYFSLITTIYEDYASTLWVFLIILFAKIFHTQSVLHGTLLLIKKQFKLNLKINLVFLLLNIGLSYLLFAELRTIGVAIASLIVLSLRFVVLQHYSKYKAK